MENEKHVADLMAGFGGFKFLPMPVVLSTNNAFPKLVLYSNYIEYRGGFFSRKLEYKNIDKVDVYFYGKNTNNIWISKTNGIGTFIGNFRQRSQLKEFLKIFKQKGCHLTEKALKEIEN